MDQFSNHKNRPDGKQVHCKECVKITGAEYRRRTPDKFDRVKESRAKSKAIARQFIVDYLRSNSCVDCGESDPVVLEFDHVRGNKSFNLSEAVKDGYGVDTIASEIEKCEVRCANCHRRVTARRGNWFWLSLIDTVDVVP